ncbi:hypothetical protein P3342_007518 [Pyrenophora teres f. teres]|nr:hypothetical protein P3342_007518 [Pyrenophora teres f. teres]
MSTNESQHVDVWEEKFDADIYSPIDSVQAENIGRDFVGWTSMYDGSDIDKAEMNEWLDDTIATMLNGQRPGNVLEIGSGTGMILFNLGDGLQSYVGLDPSRKAVQFIAETAKSIPGLASKIRITNGVPIGRALSNSGAYVMDSGLRLVPLGVVGELVVTGDGLARGYTDPARNVDRFVSVEIGGKTVRAYRTVTTPLPQSQAGGRGQPEPQPGNSSPENIVAFALLGETSDVTQIREEVAASCNTNTSLIEDIYPCSPLQEGMMALASKRPGDYIMQSVLALHDDTDEDRFRAAWERVVQSTAVLRTRIVHSSKMGMLQVVLADGIEWEQANELEQYLEKDKSVSMGLGDSLARYALVRDVGTGKRWMVWTLHHALYDGWSLPQIANLVTEVYHGAEVGKQPGFNAFIKYLGEQDHEAAAAYWQGTLADCQAISFPALPPAVQQPVADATTAFQCPALARRPSDITMSTLIRAAWALLASSYTSSDDVVFGATVTGRNAPVAGIEAMAGPTIATVPVRVRVQHSHKVSEFLHSVQQQATEMIPYEQTGLHETAKVSADARHACSFQTLLIVQPGSNGDIAHDALGEWRSHLQDFTTYALMVQCVLADDEVQIIASFDRRAIEPWQVDKMLRQFSFVMQQLATADAEAGIASIDTLTPEDRQQLWEWNHDVPPAIERCIHDLFADQAKARPDAPAICAWDGDMTYGELDVLSGRLAGHLVELGVGPEDIVPLCFEKSMWTVDNQVKLRGQRIEVEEIEHQARLAEADVAEIAVELIQPKDGEDGMLACFIVVEDSASNEDELSGKRTRLDTRTQRTIGKIQDRLERFLPQYMVPAVFIPILTLPVTWSKKIDRKRLREVGSTFSGRELAELQATTQGLKRQPSTENEKALQQLWAGVLAIDADSIGLDDSFFRLGGDSIAAMKLVGEARRAGIHLTVADLFRNPKLECLSRIGRKLLHRIVEPVLSFSLLPPAIKEDILSNQKSLGKINDLASIVDILPVTHCQKFFSPEGSMTSHSFQLLLR